MAADDIFTKEWRAFGLEAQIAAGQIASGTVALGSANLAQQGLYNQAFFGLSIGIERLAKLILIADYAIRNGGAYLSNGQLKGIGHDIEVLLDRCEPISLNYRAGKQYYKRPSLPIHNAIVKTLAEFARATRYYNLDFVATGSTPTMPEPIGAWWQRVAKPILALHYTKSRRESDKQFASLAKELIGEYASVLHHDETGRRITDLDDFLSAVRAQRVVQRYGRMYTLQIVRWLSWLISDLCDEAADRRGIRELLGLGEFFVEFHNDDRWLRDHKTWRIYR